MEMSKMNFDELDKLDKQVNQKEVQKEEVRERRSVLNRFKNHEEKEIKSDKKKKKKKKKKTGPKPKLKNSKLESFNLEMDIVEAMERLCEKHDFSKSKFAREVLRRALEDHEEL
jgi:hypothetical protein